MLSETLSARRRPRTRYRGAEGSLKPVIDRTYPLDRIAEAHAYVDQGHKRGNVILVVSTSR